MALDFEAGARYFSISSFAIGPCIDTDYQRDLVLLSGRAGDPSMIGTSIDRAALPKGFADIDELESFMARPSQDLIDDLAQVSGDILVLGAGGKMGPTLSMLARRAGARIRN